MNNETRKEVIKKLEQYRQEELLFHNEERIKYFESVIEELEKIRDEIQDLVDFEETCCGNTTLGYQCLGVVEDKISELKGESEK